MNGARMDVQDSVTPVLCSSGTTTLNKVVDTAGPGLTDAPALASLLGLKSVWQSRSILSR